ncbi:MAG: T9SS type A sorting domain-containing protein [Bacteroidia bacterium]|nr:T9SS type A sorting domain-containing protein [Bacteroidia bacterium]
MLTANLALSVGDTLIYDNNTPGGYTLEGHSTNANSLNKIMQGDWDFVVLQEQSQRPSFPIGQVQNDVFPYATFLDSVINANNTCGETMFYMTWGRKNGDASNCVAWPPVCTYQEMDSLLHLRYMQMANDNDAVVSPVGALWNYLRINHPSIELYSPDESHPSVEGSYAAACSFYTTIFRKDPTFITDIHTLDPFDAANIRTAARIVVYDSLLNWNIGAYDLTSSFNISQVSGFTYQFTNTSQNAINYSWNINSTLDTSANPTFTFSGPGIYTIDLTNTNECDTITSSQTITVTATSVDNGIDDNIFSSYPNPVKNKLYFNNIITSAIVNIYSQSGKLIHTTELVNTKTLDLELLHKGAYILETLSENKIYRMKIIKE